MEERTAVCCLSSLNIENWMNGTIKPASSKTCYGMLDNVLNPFHHGGAGRNESSPLLGVARTLGRFWGVMGFHSSASTRHPSKVSWRQSWGI